MAKCGYLAQNTTAFALTAASSAAPIASIAFATPTVTVNLTSAVTGYNAATFTPAVGHRALIQTATTFSNNGDFVLATAPSTTQVTFANSAGLAQAAAGGTISFSVPQTVLAVTAPATFGYDLKKVELSFSGVSTTVGPYLVELVSYTALTGGTSITSPASQIQQVYGPAMSAVGFTVTGPYTAEPTGATVLDSWLVTPNQTTLIYDWPLGVSYDGPVSGSIALRLTPHGTATASATVRAAMLVERC